MVMNPGRFNSVARVQGSVPLLASFGYAACDTIRAFLCHSEVQIALSDDKPPRMWSRAAGVSDHDLTNFDIKKDLVEVRAGPTTYGVIILGKIRLPAIKDDLGEGYIHVRIHDPPNRVSMG